ncbi:hypothetical protein LPB41_23295 [Thalassospira sp. MA62]|nr:hypothetical protein [Thalassospira sp. MA62]
MSKSKIIIGAIVVVAAGAVAAQIAAPAYFEGRIRANLSNPNSDFTGTFDEFDMSLIGLSMSATDISLKGKDGLNLTADAMNFSGVNWLTVLDANPFGNGLAGGATIDNLEVSDASYSLSSPSATFGDITVVTSETGPVDYIVGSGEIPDLVAKDQDGNTLLADLIAFADVSQPHIGGVTAQHLQFQPAQAKSDSDGVTLQTVTIDDCDLNLLPEGDFEVAYQQFERCGALSGTGLGLRIADHDQMTAASFSITELSKSGVENATITDLQVFEGGDSPVAGLGEMTLTGLTQSLRMDAFDDDARLDPREFQHIIENLSVDSFTIDNWTLNGDDVTGSWGKFAVEGFKDGDLAKVSIADVSFDILNLPSELLVRLGNFDITNLSLTRLQRVLEIADVDETADPTQRIETLKNMTIGEMGIVLPQLVYESSTMSGLSISTRVPQGGPIEIGFDNAAASLVQPVRFDGSNMTYAAQSQGSLDGLYVAFTEDSDIKSMIGTILDLGDFDRITLNAKSTQTWDQASGAYSYDIQEITIPDVGSVSLRANVGNLTPDTMSGILSARIEDEEQLTQAVLTQTSFDGARLEITGDKLVKAILRLMAQGNGQSVEDLQMVYAMGLMQTADSFSEYPELSAALGKLVDWISDPQHLVVTLDPENPLPIGIIAGGGVRPDTAVDLLGLQVQVNDTSN